MKRMASVLLMLAVLIPTFTWADGTQIWCSSPTAPGWRVDLPNGGCSRSFGAIQQDKTAATILIQRQFIVILNQYITYLKEKRYTKTI